jgi:hypothetical protein
MRSPALVAATLGEQHHVLAMDISERFHSRNYLEFLRKTVSGGPPIKPMLPNKPERGLSILARLDA